MKATPIMGTGGPRKKTARSERPHPTGSDNANLGKGHHACKLEREANAHFARWIETGASYYLRLADSKFAALRK